MKSIKWRDYTICLDYPRYNYGYFKGIKDNVGHGWLDVFVGPRETARFVYVIKQDRRDHKNGEIKCLVNFANIRDAMDSYLRKGYSMTSIRNIRKMTIDEFRGKMLI